MRTESPLLLLGPSVSRIVFVATLAALWMLCTSAAWAQDTTRSQATAAAEVLLNSGQLTTQGIQPNMTFSMVALEDGDCGTGTSGQYQFDVSVSSYSSNWNFFGLTINGQPLIATPFSMSFSDVVFGLPEGQLVDIELLAFNSVTQSLVVVGRAYAQTLECAATVQSTSPAVVFTGDVPSNARGAAGLWNDGMPTPVYEPGSGSVQQLCSFTQPSACVYGPTAAHIVSRVTTGAFGGACDELEEEYFTVQQHLVAFGIPGFPKDSCAAYQGETSDMFPGIPGKSVASGVGCSATNHGLPDQFIEDMRWLVLTTATLYDLCEIE